MLADEHRPVCIDPPARPDQDSAGSRRTPGNSPYSRFNLYRNPFGELTVEERAQLAVVDTPRWMRELEQPGTAVQFLGAAGFGKTTHLLAIAEALRFGTYVYLPEVGREPPIPATRPLLIDEAQRLPWWKRWSIFRRGGPLVLGTHTDLAGPLERAGFRVVTASIAGQLLPEQLMEILNRRIEASRTEAGRAHHAPVPRIERRLAAALLRESGGCIREIENKLYQQLQNAVQQGLPWPLAN